MRIYQNKFTHLLWLFLFGTVFQLSAIPINKYAIYFKDKPSSHFDPYTYFSQKAIERRIIQQLPLFDWYDLPVDEVYIEQLIQCGASLRTQSRWLNAAVVLCDEVIIRKISSLPFVKEVEFMPHIEPVLCNKYAETQLLISENDSMLLLKQVERMGEPFWRASNINGKGIRIAVFDAGFTGADKLMAFEHLRKNNRIIKTWDFVKNKENVWHGSNHGTGVWSCIAGKYNEQPIGLAWDAEFLLARTESEISEPFSEEENWVAAAEWADKNGADIINSSLGYTDKRYFTYQMNGKSTFVTRGANMAARKGMLVVNAAGNEGNSSWSIIGAPADADSVLSVGGVLPCCDYHISFSSYGPTWDKRLKPNVCAQGTVVCAQSGGLKVLQGTSFACPLVTGFAACAWQYKKELNNMELFKAIEHSGSLYPYYDYAHGYGIPQAEKFVGKNKNVRNLFNMIESANGDSLLVEILPGNFKPITEGFKNLADFSNESKTGTEPPDLLYYQVLNGNNLIEKYYVILAGTSVPVGFAKSDFKKGQIIRVYYKGQFEEIKF